MEWNGMELKRKTAAKKNKNLENGQNLYNQFSHFHSIRKRKNKNLENDQNITISLVTYCLVFVAKASFITFNHGF